MEELSVGKNNNDVGFWLKQLSNKMENSRNQNVAHLELTSSQFEVLLFLMENREKEINQIDIEKAMNRSNPTITGIVKRLEAKNFIERVPSSKDKRYKSIILTDKALQLHDEGAVGREKAEKHLLRGFSDEERAQLVDYIKRMIDNVMHEKED